MASATAADATAADATVADDLGGARATVAPEPARAAPGGAARGPDREPPCGEAAQVEPRRAEAEKDET